MPNFKALVVGIDDYPPPNQLPSCVNDANAMFGLLRSVGFQVEQLLNAQATTSAVTEKLRELFKDVKSDDRLVFYYSGHGFTDRRGNLMEEYLVLMDGLLQDDVLAELTQAVTPGTLTVVLDSCFSGGMEKYVMSADSGRAELEVAKVKAWKPTAEDAKKFKLEARPEQPKGKGAPTADKIQVKKFGLSEAASKQVILRTSEEPPTVGALGKSLGATKGPGSDEVGQTQTKGLVIAACLETETAAASTSQTEGQSAFTYAMLSAVRSLGGRQSTTAIFQKAAEILKPNFRQTPLVIAPASMPGLAASSFLRLESLGGPDVGTGPAAATGQIDPKLLGAVLAALMPALFEMRPKSFSPAWSSPDVTGPLKGDDPTARLLIALLRSVVKAACPQPN